MKTCEIIEKELEQSGFLKGAPFDTVNLILVFGGAWGEPELGRIVAKHSELSASIELPKQELTRLSVDELVPLFSQATLSVLRAVGARYSLDEVEWNLPEVG